MSRRCSNCKRAIADTESCWRDFDKRIICNDCYKPTFTLVLPKHGTDYGK